MAATMGSMLGHLPRDLSGSRVTSRSLYLGEKAIKVTQQRQGKKKAWLGLDRGEDTRGHYYRRLYPWANVQEFCDHLLQDVVYDEDELLVLNKPYGVAKEAREAPEYSMQAAIPIIQERLELNRLEVVKCAEKYTSGLTILAKTRHAADKFRAAVMRAKGTKQPPYTFRAVVVGSPVPDAASERVGIKLERSHNPDVQRHYPVVLPEYNLSRRQIDLGNVKPVVVSYKTVFASSGATLVEVSCTAMKWHFLRVYMASHLAPILGDHLYGSRVCKVMGVPMEISPEVAPTLQVIPRELARALQVKREEYESIPTHLHLQRISLPSFHGKGNDLVLTARPPKHFRWTCETLGLAYWHPALTEPHY